jgi:hypothetical protein
VNLPFTQEQFLDLFGDYNRALWPALVALWIATTFAVVRLYRRSSNTSRLLAGLLAVHWAWSGAVYHLIYFRRINPAAVLFGTVFLIQAALLVWRGVAGSQLTFSPQRSGWGIAGTILIFYSLAYPAIGMASGLQPPRFPSFGVPCPTTLLTAGLLLLVPRNEARILGVIPILWSAVGGSAAFVLGIPPDLALPVAGAILLGYVVTRRGLFRRAILLLVACSLLGGCGSSPASPENNATNIVQIGPQVLRIVFQAPCAGLGQGVLPLVYTRVNVAASANEWMATAAGDASGDVQARFHQSGPNVIAGAIAVAGTITGTAIHLPELFSGPAWNLRVTFSGQASLQGTAFIAGVFGATAPGLDGTGSGSLTLTDAAANTCTGSAFSWSIFPEQAK